MQSWQDHAWVRRSLFLATNLLAGIVLTALVIIPVRDFFNDRDARIAEQRSTLVRLQAIAAQEPDVQSRLGQATVNRGEFLSGPNEGVINADLQTRLKGMVESAGARVRSIRNLPPKTNDQLRYIGSRIEILGSLQNLHRAIYAVESAKPYLFMTSAAIKLSTVPGRQDVPQEPTIEAQLDILGALQIVGRDR